MADQKLTVSLILNGASFTKQIQDVNKKIKLAESEFGKISSSTKDFGSSMEGAQAKVKSLTEKLELQGKKVSLYKDAISKSKTKLDELTNKYKDVSDTLTDTNKKYDEACEKYGKNSDEAKKLKGEIEKLEKSKGNLETRILSTNSSLDSLQTELYKSETKFNELDREVQEASKALGNFKVDQIKKNIKEASEQVEKFGDKLSGIGEGIGKVSSKMKKVTVPIAGVGAAAIAVGMNFETSMSNVQAISGATGDDLQRLEDIAREMGSKTSKSASESADALSYMALAGFDVEEMCISLEPVLRLSEAGAMDLALASDLATDSMGGLGLGVEDLNGYLDKVANTSASSNTNIQQLMEAFINVGATTSSLGIGLSEASAALGILGNNGTKGYEAGTKLNSILTRMTAQSKISAGAWKDLGVKIYDSEGNFRGLTTILKETKEKLKDYNDEQAQTFLKAAVGTDNITDFKNLLNSTGGELEDLTKKIDNSDGALNKMATTMQDNVKGQFTTVMSQLEEVGIQLAETLLPVISDLLTEFSKLVDWFSKLSPETKEAIVKFGLLAIGANAATAGLSGMFKSAGSVVKIAGKLAGKLGTASAATSAASSAAAVAGGTAGFGALASGIGAAVSAAAPWVLAGAAVVGTGVAIAHNLKKEVVPEVDLFADKVEVTSKTIEDEFGNAVLTYERNVTKISDATEEAVGAYIELDDNVRNSLLGMYATSTTVTKDMAKELKIQFSEMGSQIKGAFEEDMNETTTVLQNFFNNSKALSKAEEEGIIQDTIDYYTKKQETIDGYEKQINDILKLASTEKRELTQEEYNTITDLQNKMREESINALSEQEIEAQLILERMKGYDERMTAEMVSEHIKQLNEQRDGAIKAANEEYDEVVRTAIKMRDETGTISAEQADEIIKEAERQRDETIEAAEKTRDDAVKTMKKMNKETFKDVDETTGKIITKWDKVKSWWSDWNPKEKVLSVVNKIKDVFTGGSSSSDKKSGKSIDTPQRISTFSLSPIRENIQPISDSLHVPSARDVATQMRSAGVTGASVGSVEQTSVSENEMVKTMKEQNQLLLQMVSLLSNNNDFNVSVQVDGRQIAKATAKYMDTEINSINQRRTRLGGAF